MKQLIALLIVLLFLMGAVPTTAQEPLPPAPGSVGTGVPLGPAPAQGELIPKAPEQYLPTWQAPLPQPTATPTPVDFDWYDIVALQIVPVRTCPAMTCYVIGRLLPGEVITVRWAGPGWVQLESGYLAGNYIPVDLNLWRPL